MATKAQTLEEANAGEGCLGKSAADEPVFVLCGRDPVSGRLLREWADWRELHAVRTATLDTQERQKIDGARRLAFEMDAWPKKFNVVGS